VKGVKNLAASSMSKSLTTLPSYPLNYVLFPSGVDLEIDLDEMVGAQSILEDHVLRVWDVMENEPHDSFFRTVSGQLLTKPFHRPAAHPSPDLSSSGIGGGYCFGRFPSRLSATSSSFCQPEFNISCCSEMDCSFNNDESVTGISFFIMRMMSVILSRTLSVFGVKGVMPTLKI